MASRVWVVAEMGESLRIQGDLLMLVDAEGIATLYRTVETYVEPSQGIIDKWHLAERPFWADPETHMFRMLEEVETRPVHSEEEIQDFFQIVQGI